MAAVNIFKNETDVVSFAAGAVICQEGEPGDTMYVVQQGEVDILVNGRVMETAGPGGVIGEMALVDASRRSAAAVAKTDCILVPLDETKFKIVVHNTPFFAIQVMRVMADRLRRMNELV
jgi:CRP/FNR family cyclic AMP-dependent transcriptional regulator